MAWDPGFEAAFTPRSIAVLGASSRERGGGNQFIWSIKSMGYEGTIYPINPTVEEVLGLKCYPSLAAVPEVPDLVIIAVGAGRAEQALEECIAKGARNIHMFTAGFAETGEEEGAALAEKLRRDSGERQAQHRRAQLHGDLLAAGQDIALGPAADRSRSRRHDHAERRSRQRVRPHGARLRAAHEQGDLLRQRLRPRLHGLPRVLRERSRNALHRHVPGGRPGRPEAAAAWSSGSTPRSQ